MTTAMTCSLSMYALAPSHVEFRDIGSKARMFARLTARTFNCVVDGNPLPHPT